MPRNVRPGIIRHRKTGNFFSADNAPFSNERLSWEARGLLAYLLSKPDNWQVRLHDLMARGPAGEHKIRRMLRELEENGYLVRERHRRADGTYYSVTRVYENPDADSARVELGLDEAAAEY